ncbi:MAG: MBL fold metallo-hydrolase [Candidatus Omnitrophica bacterium]|nr:MBL fold metallo-hydrolase [Candidatus Omnitrophota bacterium]
MKTRRLFLFCLIALPSLARFAGAEIESLSPNLSIIHDAVNGVLITQDGKTAAVYGDPRPAPSPVERVFFTHFRRDVVWAGRQCVDSGARAVVPEGEKDYFTDAESYWRNQFTARYHDYAQQTTKIPAQSFKNVETVKGGDSLEWRGLTVRVLDTPGFTRRAISYLFEIDGRTVACVGDLIYGDGRILDIYSLQDSIQEPRTGGYHGYMARAADLIQSLQAVAAASPDLLIPARGPVIRSPQEAIQNLISRLRAVYKNYLSISALRWYWKDEYIQGCAARMLGAPGVDWMPMAENMMDAPPEWIVPMGTSRLLLSESGDGFLIDCGSPDVIREIHTMQADKRIRSIEGIYVTHYHDDHTNQLPEASDAFDAPVYFCAEQADILLHPDRYHMPAQTDKPVIRGQLMGEGETLRWHEFEMTFSFFPGQTLYHGGLLVKKDRGESIFFIGDSFTPSGVDDYCALNRNLLHPGMGYLYCLETLQNMAPDYHLINEHVIPPFRFSREQLQFMIDALEKRIDLMRDLFPWDDVNYGIDSQWVRFHPYGVEATPGEQVQLNVVIFNHSPREQTYTITPRAPQGWRISTEPLSISIPPRETRSVPVYVAPPLNASGVSLLTADIHFADWTLRQWPEAMIKIK